MTVVILIERTQKVMDQGDLSEAFHSRRYDFAAVEAPEGNQTAGAREAAVGAVANSRPHFIVVKAQIDTGIDARLEATVVAQ